MRCQKCGYIGFDYLKQCKKCGADMTAARDGLGLPPVKPAIPSFLGVLAGDVVETPPPSDVVMPQGADLDESSLPEIDFEDELVFVSEEPADIAASPQIPAAGGVVELTDDDLKIDLDDEEADKDMDFELDFSMDEEFSEVDAPAVSSADEPVTFEIPDDMEPEELKAELNLAALDAGLATEPSAIDLDDRLELDLDYKPNLEPPAIKAAVEVPPAVQEEESIEFDFEMEGEDDKKPVPEATAVEPAPSLAPAKQQQVGPDDPTVISPPVEKAQASAPPQSLKIMSDTADGLVIEISESDLEDLMVDLEEGKLGADQKGDETLVSPPPKTK